MCRPTTTRSSSGVPTSTLSHDWGPGWAPPATASPLTPVDVERARRIADAFPVFGIDRPWGWQWHTLAVVAAQRDGIPVYSTVTVIICRQNGKTMMLFLVVLERLTRGHVVIFTLHERQKAREKWEDIAVALTAAAPQRFKVSRAPGREKITDRLTGGVCALVTPDDAGGRSHTADCVIVDEAAHIKPAFLAAARATMLTRPTAQVIMISSGMVDTSEDLADARDAAYEDLLKPVEDRRFGVVEWAAKTTPGHEGLDLDDEDLWARCIPTLGLPGGARIDAVRDNRRAMPPADFAREFLSVPSGSPLAPPITDSLWAECHTAVLPPVAELRHRVLAVETSPDQAFSSIVIAGIYDNTVHAALLANGDGDAWLWTAMSDAARESRPERIIIDALSPAAGHVARLRAQAARDIHVSNATDMARSCAALMTMLTSGGIRIVGDDALTLAALSAIRRPIADAGWAWKRRDGSPVDVTPLVALSLAAHAAYAEQRG